MFTPAMLAHLRFGVIVSRTYFAMAHEVKDYPWSIGLSRFKESGGEIFGITIRACVKSSFGSRSVRDISAFSLSGRSDRF